MEARALFRLPLSRPSIPRPRPQPLHPPSTFRKLTTTVRRRADKPINISPPPSASASATSKVHGGLGVLGKEMSQNSRSFPSIRGSGARTGGTGAPSGTSPDSADAGSMAEYYDKHITEMEHHLHIYAHKHNTHLTLTNEKRNPLISISAGNLGFRKAQRGQYDAAHQLAAYLLTRMQQQGWTAQIQRLELVFRGFGQGREAVTKVIMGVEGVGIRDKVVRVVDKTRLKIGGTRSPKPRRLG